MLAKQPQVARERHRGSNGVAEFIRTVGVICESSDWMRKSTSGLEPDRLEVEVEGELRELFELKG
jgi:hypothetical protein